MSMSIFIHLKQPLSEFNHKNTLQRPSCLAQRIFVDTLSEQFLNGNDANAR